MGSQKRKQKKEKRKKKKDIRICLFPLLSALPTETLSEMGPPVCRVVSCHCHVHRRNGLRQGRVLTFSRFPGSVGHCIIGEDRKTRRTDAVTWGTRLATVHCGARTEGGPRHSMDDPSRHPIYETKIASVEFFGLVPSLFSVQLTFKMPYIQPSYVLA